MSKLSEIQQKLKAPKGQRNDFGKYNYRSCEDILEAVKPLLGTSTLVLNDEVVEVGGRIYVKATAVLDCTGEEIWTASAYAREAEDKKGMDAAQITGAASSYARKYALNGLFCIDDTKDADATNDHGRSAAAAPQQRRKVAPASNSLVQAKKRLKAAAIAYRGEDGVNEWCGKAIEAVLERKAQSVEDIETVLAHVEGRQLNMEDGSIIPV